MSTERQDKDFIAWLKAQISSSAFEARRRAEPHWQLGCKRRLIEELKKPK